MTALRAVLPSRFFRPDLHVTLLRNDELSGRLFYGAVHLASFFPLSNRAEGPFPWVRSNRKTAYTRGLQPDTSIYTVPMADVTTIKPLNRDEEAFLRALGRVMTLLPRVVDADMLEEHPITGTEYMVLVHLSEVPHNQMRMSELANMCGLSLSGMTRVVNRLESQSLVTRQKAPDDGRAWLAVLTSAGWAQLKQAWPTNLASVRRHVFSRLEGCDIAAAADVLERIAPGD